MQVWTDLKQIPATGPSVVTIGNFDGVHRGHQAVLSRVVALASADNARAVAVTFDPHPAVVHRPALAPPLITSLDARLKLMSSMGLDGVLVVPYTIDFAEQTPQEFVVRYMVNGLAAHTVVVGHDVRFGKQNAGTLSTMVELGGLHGFEVLAIEDAGGSDHHRWSSTVIRDALAQGNVSAAREILGRPHGVSGVVVHGDARGRTLGFPTANLGPTAGMVPADGVYAGWLQRVQFRTATENLPAIGAPMPAAISIGTNPTFDGAQRRVEAYVLDRTDLDLYGEHVTLTFAEYVRPTIRFDSVKPLIAQMRDDVARTRAILDTTSPDIVSAK